MARGGMADALASLLAHSITILRGETALPAQPCYVSPASGRDGPTSSPGGPAAGAAGEAIVHVYGAADFDIKRGDLFVMIDPSGGDITYQVEYVAPPLQVPGLETGVMGEVAVKAVAKAQQ